MAANGAPANSRLKNLLAHLTRLRRQSCLLRESQGEHGLDQAQNRVGLGWLDVVSLSCTNSRKGSATGCNW